MRGNKGVFRIKLNPEGMLFKQKPHRVLHPFAPGGFVVDIARKTTGDPVCTVFITEVLHHLVHIVLVDGVVAVGTFGAQVKIHFMKG